MNSDQSFADLMAQLRTGNSDAATRVFEQYSRRLIGLARNHLDGRVRRHVDPEDVVNSVLKSFFLRTAEGQYDVRSPESLWALLVEITLRKCGRWRQHFAAQKRDLAKQVSLDSQNEEGLAAPDASPEEPAILAELLEELIRGLDTRERRIVQLKQQGYSGREIAEQVGLSEFSVSRVLSRVRKRLQQWCAHSTDERGA